MAGNAGWHRVSRRNPCPVCGKPDWCTYRLERRPVVCCMRVVSARRFRNGGYAHEINPRVRRPRKPEPEPKPEYVPVAISRMLARWRSQAAEYMPQLRQLLGVGPAAIELLDTGYDPSRMVCYWPMYDHRRRIIGVRVRTCRPGQPARKFCLRGSRTGLFLPRLPLQERTVYIAEGPTDCLALLNVGFTAIGRPSNIGGRELILRLFARERPGAAVLVLDRDEPGSAAEAATLRGGAELREGLLKMGIPALTWRPPPIGSVPVKDVRDYLGLGGDPMNLPLAEQARREGGS